MTRGSCVVWFSNVCFVWVEEFLVMNFTHHILHHGWPMCFLWKHGLWCFSLISPEVRQSKQAISHPVRTLPSDYHSILVEIFNLPQLPTSRTCLILLVMTYFSKSVLDHQTAHSSIHLLKVNRWEVYVYIATYLCLGGTQNTFIGLQIGLRLLFSVFKVTTTNKPPGTINKMLRAHLHQPTRELVSKQPEKSNYIPKTAG